MSTRDRQLVIAVVKGHRRVERVMEGFLELGLPGATIVDAKGMGQIVSTELPVFAGFRSLFPGGGEESYVILSVLTVEQASEAFALLEEGLDVAPVITDHYAITEHRAAFDALRHGDDAKIVLTW